jgi:uncharacterized caspase-like protein
MAIQRQAKSADYTRNCGNSMRRLFNLAFLAFALLAATWAPATAAEGRFALVIGDASYRAQPLSTTANDAALVAQSLRVAGFEVMGARDLDEAALRRTFREFVEVLRTAGPSTVAIVYFAGYALQLEGENYLLPVDAHLTRGSDIPLQALRLSDYSRAIAELRLKASFVIVDAARPSPFALPDLAGGLAWVEPERNMMLAFNAAPGTVAPVVQGGYGPYARALAEMILQGSLSPVDLFDRVRLRVHDLTKGGQIPWQISKVEAKFYFLERSSAAPARADSPELTAAMRSQPMRGLGFEDAYMVALLRDTLDAYGEFLAEYANNPLAKRLKTALAARREAIIWRRTYETNTTEAYRTYLERYPRGPHVGDSDRLLDRLTIVQSSLKSAPMAIEVPPPPQDEQDYAARPVLVLDDPTLELPPPLPASVRFLEPPPKGFEDLPAPPAPVEAFKLAAAKLPSLPSYINVPTDVRPVTGSLANANASVTNVAVDRSQQSPTPAVSPDEQKNTVSPEVSAATERGGRSALNEPAPVESVAAPPNPREGHATAGSTIAALAPPSPDNNVSPSSLNEELPSRETGTIAPAATGAPPFPHAVTKLPLPLPRPLTMGPLNGGIPLPIPRAAALPSGFARTDSEGAPTPNGSRATAADQPPFAPTGPGPSLPPPAAPSPKAASKRGIPDKPQEETCQVVNNRRICKMVQ